MVKFKKCICGVLLFTTTVLSVPGITFAMTTNDTERENITEDKMLIALEPYQEVIDEINNKYNSSICIQEDNIEEVYNNTKDISVDEFKQKTESAYLEAINSEKEIIFYADDVNDTTTNVDIEDDEYLVEDTNGIENKISQLPNTSNPSLIKLEDGNGDISTKSTTIFENVYQYYEWTQGKVYIKSNIAGDSGLGSLYYTSILARGTVVSVSKTHFRSSGSDVSLMDSSKTCYVKYTGRLFSSEGLDLLVPMTVKVYYFANGGDSNSGEIA